MLPIMITNNLVFNITVYCIIIVNSVKIYANVYMANTQKIFSSRKTISFPILNINTFPF